MPNSEKIEQLWDYFNTRLEARPFGTPSVAVSRDMLSEAALVAEIHRPQLADYLRQRLAENENPLVEVDR